MLKVKIKRSFGSDVRIENHIFILDIDRQNYIAQQSKNWIVEELENEAYETSDEPYFPIPDKGPCPDEVIKALDRAFEHLLKAKPRLPNVCTDKV